MQWLIQRQWWSNLSTHLPHILQWREVLLTQLWQRSQNRHSFSTSFTSSLRPFRYATRTGSTGSTREVLHADTPRTRKVAPWRRPKATVARAGSLGRRATRKVRSRARTRRQAVTWGQVGLRVQAEVYWYCWACIGLLGLVIEQLSWQRHRPQHQSRHFIASMLEDERRKASFSRLDLSHLIYGGKEGLRDYLRKQKVIDDDPVLRFDPSFLHQSREDMMSHMGRKVLRLHEYHHLFPLDGSAQITKTHLLNYQTPLSLHAQMFLTTLDNLCDEEQRRSFYEPALKGQILGCYAQTELGHGSDIQRLETTATFEPETDSFLVNSPTISSAKWWIGDLGVHCTHAALFAQLIIAGRSHGLHAFLVPIRDPKTLRPLPGVEVGDVGPKQGFNTKDNGYCLIRNLRIPRRNMLMKFQTVSKEGKYALQGDQKISYATMLVTRSAINAVIAKQYSKIITIITRYSLLRKQFRNEKGQEIPVLNYQTQQAKVISRIGEVYAYLATSKAITELSSFVFREAKEGRFDRLNEAHILTSATKAHLTQEALNNAEIARRAAGGHGFHLYSGMIGTQHDISPAVTFEGQYTILMLQVARFLFKALMRLQKGRRLAPSVQYLEELAKGDLSVKVDERSLDCPFFVNTILRNFACVAVKNMALKLANGMKQGLSEKQSWDSYAGIALTEAAAAHSIYTIHGYYLQLLKKTGSPQLRAVLSKFCLLYGLEKLIERAGQVYETSILDSSAFQLFSRKREGLLEVLRPEALTMVEAFEYSDNILQSAIAHSNCRPYENLIDWARRHNTVNRPEERAQIVEAIRQAKSQLKPRL